MASATFRTLADALDAGYTLPSKNDKDISGPSNYGYSYQDDGGRTTVDVYFTEDRNILRQKGCVRVMFPPA